MHNTYSTKTLQAITKPRLDGVSLGILFWYVIYTDAFSTPSESPNLPKKCPGGKAKCHKYKLNTNLSSPCSPLSLQEAGLMKTKQQQSYSTFSKGNPSSSNLT